MKSKIKLVISLVALFMLPAFITGFENEETYGDTKFKDNVVFYVQHQDDETLWASAAIIEAINEVGADHVYVVQVSYGTGIKVFKNEKVFENMTSQEKYEYREREFLAAVNDLGVKRENVILLPRINNSNSTSFDLMESQALKFEKELKSVDINDMQIGDVFIKGGSPGHCVIVVDMAQNKSTGEKVFMLAQSYMPAQQTQLLINPNDDTLNTPEWTFTKDQLKRF